MHYALYLRSNSCSRGEGTLISGLAAQSKWVRVLLFGQM
jgi:hypothetical protein